MIWWIFLKIILTKTYPTHLFGCLTISSFENLPSEWTTFDLASFSRGKSLWDYQQSALQNALKALHKYYKDFEGNKPRFFQWYLDNQIELDADEPRQEAR